LSSWAFFAKTGLTYKKNQKKSVVIVVVCVNRILIHVSVSSYRMRLINYSMWLTAIYRASSTSL